MANNMAESLSRKTERELLPASYANCEAAAILLTEISLHGSMEEYPAGFEEKVLEQARHISGIAIAVWGNDFPIDDLNRQLEILPGYKFEG